MVDINYENGKIRIWTEGEEVDFNKTSKSKYKPIWILKWMDAIENQFKMIDAPDDVDINELVDDPKRIMKVESDREVSYGDGGHSELFYPIYTCQNPPIGIRNSPD